MDFIYNNLIEILGKLLVLWPYFILTIPFAVLINLTGGAEYLKQITGKNPYIAIFLATIIGAFSPLCSCGVIPVIASLLFGGVPLAPVMSFWVASPSMDPEIFFLSVGLIGWDLAVWRMIATLVMSLSAGIITLYLLPSLQQNESILSGKDSITITPIWQWVKNGTNSIISSLTYRYSSQLNLDKLKTSVAPIQLATVSCDTCYEIDETVESIVEDANSPGCDCASNDPGDRVPKTRITLKRVWSESFKASIMVAKFMLLAIIIQTLISTLIPPDLIKQMLNGNSVKSLGIAALISVPFYTSNLTALPLMSGLLEQGLNPAVALVFLIAGPTTTLPAMAAVWGLVNRRIFLLYVAIPLVGALLTGMAYIVM